MNSIPPSLKVLWFIILAGGESWNFLTFNVHVWWFICHLSQLSRPLRSVRIILFSSGSPLFPSIKVAQSSYSTQLLKKWKFFIWLLCQIWRIYWVQKLWNHPHIHMGRVLRCLVASIWPLGPLNRGGWNSSPPVALEPSNRPWLIGLKNFVSFHLNFY